MTHLPMGMAMGAFLFGLASLRWASLTATARHCIVLGVLFVPPTIVLGFFDWLHFYDGDLEYPFKFKIALAFILPLLFIAALLAGRGERSNPRLRIVLYALCLLVAIGLGYLGGEVTHG
jgi:hypothetical protein